MGDKKIAELIGEMLGSESSIYKIQMFISMYVNMYVR